MGRANSIRPCRGRESRSNILPFPPDLIRPTFRKFAKQATKSPKRARVRSGRFTCSLRTIPEHAPNESRRRATKKHLKSIHDIGTEYRFIWPSSFSRLWPGDYNLGRYSARTQNLLCFYSLLDQHNNNHRATFRA